MSYLAQCFARHIVRYLDDNRAAQFGSRKMLFTIPDLPEKPLWSIANAIYAATHAAPDVQLTLKIAAIVADIWSDSGKETTQKLGWHDELGNLTHYRNLPEISGKCHVIVLCGADRVTDAASLADFHSCDLTTIWQSEMMWGNEKTPSFKGWISQKLQASGFTDISDKDLNTINRILTPILNCGRGDLIKIDDWLGKLDLSSLGSIVEVPGYLLANLQAFDLPVLARFPINLGRKQLDPYIKKAEDFFNYTIFLESSKQKNALKSVRELRDLLEEGESFPFSLDQDDIGPYSSIEELLDGLIEYIQNDSADDKACLLQCDFVIICDKILKFKKKTEVEKKDSTRTLHGNPIEVLLSALWLSLQGFCRSRRGEGECHIDCIDITSRLFKHDIDESDDNQENAELAGNYLRRLLGGIDELVAQQSICGPDNEDIPIVCKIFNSEMTYRYSSTSEPTLEFEVAVAGSMETVKRHFVWRLPGHHQFRLSVDLLKLAHEAITKHTELYKLPVFHLPYYEELLDTTSEQEIRQILLHAIRGAGEGSKVLTNLLSPAWASLTDPLVSDLKQLALRYQAFLEEASREGLFSAIFSRNSSSWFDLHKAYREAMGNAKGYVAGEQSAMIGMLPRAFLVINPRPVNLGESWHSEVHEQSGIATVLHPSVLEMFQAQVVFLFHCFSHRVKEELRRYQQVKAFQPFAWQRHVDLATIQSPLVGLLDENDNLNTHVRGEGLVHRIGTAPVADALLSTRLMLEYNEYAGEERSIRDTEMFRESSESKQLTRVMLDYFDLHPHARDGLSIAVYRDKDIQPIIAAVHGYLKILATPPMTDDSDNTRFILGSQRHHPYAISVTLFTESPDESASAIWVQQWRERWEAAETEKAYDLYRYCRFSIAHRVIEQHNQSAFIKLILGRFEVDIAVLYDFIGAAKASSFEQVGEFDIISHDLKYPILEKACCTINDPGRKYRRQRITSNRQFGLADCHANLLHSLRTKTPQTGTLIVANGEFNPWIELVNRLHEKAEWVVCIDPNMDERLIKQGDADRGRKRDIIGFGSGVGNQGEDNYTISTEEFTLEYIQRRVSQAIQERYAPEANWTIDECKDVAQGIIATAATLSGLSLVRATGVKDSYIRDFMAYAFTRKMLRPEEKLLCESLVSLDAYLHWFDMSDNSCRPDLMWLRVAIKGDGRLDVRIQLLECKLSSKPEAFVKKACQQIDNGLKVLTAAFAPKENGASSSVQRPDKRYWWVQLHRLIASKTEVESRDYQAARGALERLADGDFDISWTASVFLFGINGDDEIRRTYYWPSAGIPGVTGNVYEIGGGFVRHLFSSPDVEAIDWSRFNGQGQDASALLDFDEIGGGQDDGAPYDDDEDEDEDEDEGGAQISDGAKEVDSGKAMAGDQASGGHQIPDAPANTSTPIVFPLPPPSLITGSDAPSLSGGQLQVAEQGATNKVDNEPQPSIPSGKILLGRTIPGELPVYWEFMHPNLPNRHMIIFGSSGQGKTYAIQAILCEMQKFQQHSLIVDYTNGFLPNQLERTTQAILRPTQRVVRNNPLPINPFLAQASDNSGIEYTETPNNIAKRIAGLFDSVYAIGDQQYSCLHQVIMDGVDRLGAKMDLEKMLAMLVELKESKEYKSPALSLSNKLRPFVLDRPFASGPNSYDWDQLFSDPNIICNIFQLYGMDMHSGRLITEFILWDLYGFLQARGIKTNPKVIVLDEVQNLDHREDSPLSKYLREGRKFGISLILATQSMSGMKADEIDRMFFADQQLFFRPSDTEMKNFAKILSQIDHRGPDEWVRRLSNLGKGECYSVGQCWDPQRNKLVKKAVKIHITPLGERGFDS